MSSQPAPRPTLVLAVKYRYLPLRSKRGEPTSLSPLVSWVDLPVSSE